MINYEYCVQNNIGKENLLTKEQLLSIDSFDNFRDVSRFQEITDIDLIKAIVEKFDYILTERYNQYAVSDTFNRIPATKTTEFSSWIAPKLIEKNKLRFFSQILNFDSDCIKSNFEHFSKSDFYFSEESILNMSEEVIKMFLDSKNIQVIKNICKLKKFTKEFVLENIEYLNVLSLLMNSNLDFKLENLFDKKKLACLKDECRYLDYNNWDDISCRKLTKTFITKYKDKLNWKNLIRYNDFTESFIKKNLEYLDDSAWAEICIYQKFSIDFIRANLSRIKKFSRTLYSKEELEQIKNMMSNYSDLF
jgi:hypothetical protein